MTACLKETWRSELVSEDHHERRNLTMRSLIKNTRNETDRQVSSSSSSDDVVITDSCWITHSSANTPYVVFGLSNGSVCLMNAVNLSKNYLFESEREAKDHKPQPVAVHSHCYATGDSSCDVLLCMVLDGHVQTCEIKPTDQHALRQLKNGSSTRVLALPDDRNVTYTQVRFNGSGSAALSLVLSVDHNGGLAEKCQARIAALERTEKSTFKAAGGWKTLRPNAPVVLQCCEWWDEVLVLCAWSDGLVELRSTADWAPVAQYRFAQRGHSDCVKGAVARRLTGKDVARYGADGLVALTLEDNVVSCHTVHVMDVVSGSQNKRPRVEHASEEGRVSLRLVPCNEAYCTEDIPIRSITLMRSFIWVLCVQLESGGLLFLDARTLELLVYHQTRRIGGAAPRKGQGVAATREQCLAMHADPYGALMVDQNVVIFLKP